MPADSHSVHNIQDSNESDLKGMLNPQQIEIADAILEVINSSNRYMPNLGGCSKNLLTII